jgi:hypothetical protein
MPLLIPNSKIILKIVLHYPKRNFIENNVFVNIKLIHNGNADWSYFGKNYIASGDPGFENYNEMNFQLKPSSEIFKLLPGFKAIPFHKIGIQEKNRTLQP